jgi:HlyD family secretion protein
MKIMRISVLLLFAAFIVSCVNNHRSDAYGTFEAIDVLVSSEATGRLLAFEISQGDVVKEGTFIGMVDTTDHHLRILQIEKQQMALDARISSINSQIRVQQQQLENLNIEKSRVESLFSEGAATQQQLDDVNGKHDLLIEQIASTRVSKESVLAEKGTLDIQKEQVRESIRKCYIINPIDGTVLDKYAEAGEVTAFGKPLYKIANLDEIQLRVYISGAQLPDVKLGQEVEVLIDQGEKGFSGLTGRVAWISPEAEFTPKIIQTKEERVNLVYAVKVLVKNDGTLKIGMPGEVNFN